MTIIFSAIWLPVPDAIFFFVFWIGLVTLLVTYLKRVCLFRAADILIALLVFVVLFVALHAIINNPDGLLYYWYNEPVRQYIVSVKEMPIQTLEYNGQTIEVVVIANKPRNDETWNTEGFGLRVRRVSDIVPYICAPGSSLYLVKERGRFWWMWGILPRECILPENPLEKDITNKKAD